MSLGVPFANLTLPVRMERTDGGGMETHGMAKRSKREYAQSIDHRYQQAGRARERQGAARRPGAFQAPARFSDDAATRALVKFFDGLTGMWGFCKPSGNLPPLRCDSWTFEASGGVETTLTDCATPKDSTLRQFFSFGLRWDFS